jgi:ribosomal protein S18 acetylase RimI-like enzyme
MTDTPVTTSDPVRIEAWKEDPAGVRSDLEKLSDLLRACVGAGASVSFVLPFSHEDAKAFWRDQVLLAVTAGSRCVLLARSAGNIVGTVQLDLATPPNQPHRAEVKKLLVHPNARGRGIAKSLMVALEAQAREARRTLLTLDTVTGGPAEALYLSLGYVAVGVIPGYALNFDSSVLEATSVMYKKLSLS